MDSDFAKTRKLAVRLGVSFLNSEEGLYRGRQKNNRLLRYQR
jgi:hypothetical protein